MRHLLTSTLLILFTFSSSTRAADSQHYSGQSAEVERAITIQQQARAEGKLMLLALGADWCHDSVSFAETLQDNDVAQQINSQFKVMIADAGFLTDGAELMEHYSQEMYWGTPTVLVINPETSEVLNEADLLTWMGAASRDKQTYLDYFEAGNFDVSPKSLSDKHRGQITAFKQEMAKRVREGNKLVGPLLADFKTSGTKPAQEFIDKWDELSELRHKIPAALNDLNKQAQTAHRASNPAPLEIPQYGPLSWESQNSYFPERGQWQSQSPKTMGLNQRALDKAVKFAQDNEYSGSRDLRIAILKGFAREPFHQLLGPVKKRGGPAGMILKNGFKVAEWGDTQRVDMTFSVTKSYLTSVAGLAWDRGLINDVNDTVGQTIWDGTFDGEHNQKIRWQDLFDQSSDWSGELFGIKDWADRPPSEGGLDDWRYRELNEPGTVMEYNDVRVNLLAYSLLQVWRQPLPQILKTHLMDKIDASTTWRWYGYKDAWVTVDGMKMKSVTGGGHSGGGIFISTEDQARFGLLVANHGRWKDEQILSKEWLDKAITPSKANESYGYMWWLNQGPRKWKQVDDESLFYAAGFGGNFIVVDRKNDMVIITRWLEPSQIGEFVKRVRKAL